MTDFLLNGGRKFAKCFRKAVRHENGVVTEAVCAVRGERDAAFADAFRQITDFAFFIRDRHHADESRAALLIAGRG